MAKLPGKNVAGRYTTSVFRRKYFKIATENPILGVMLIYVVVVLVPLWYLPRLLKLRRYIRAYRKKNPHRSPRVVYWTDTLDEVNGIANNIRLTVAHHQKEGRPVHLIGAVTRDQEYGRIENHFVMLLPLLFGMPQLGYPDSELSCPHIGPLLRFVKRYPPDVIELETPNPGSWVMMFCAKILGIKVISHYRTDGVGYTRLLVKFKPMHYMVHTCILIFSQLTRPIIVPSRDFRNLIRKQLFIPDRDIVLLPRGIDLHHFYPERRSAGNWSQFSSTQKPVRFVTVGRVSVEKALPFLEQAWREFRQTTDQAELLVVGHGPYLETMKQRLSDCEEVSFTGQLSGETLWSLYAEADFLLFPSGNDTFGNVVVEAMASGTTVMISDRGGPKDIVEGKDCGWIIPFQDSKAWVQGLETCTRLKLEQPEVLSRMEKSAVAGAQEYTLAHSCEAHWKYFCELTGLNPA